MCSDVVSLSCQASLNGSMDSLKVELNTALQCDREVEDEVTKLKVRGNTSKQHIDATKHTIQSLLD